MNVIKTAYERYFLEPRELSREHGELVHNHNNKNHEKCIQELKQLQEPICKDNNTGNLILHGENLQN